MSAQKGVLDEQYVHHFYLARVCSGLESIIVIATSCVKIGVLVDQ